MPSTRAILAVAAVALAATAPAVATAQHPETVSFSAADGLQLHGRLYRGADAAAPVVLLFHQGGGSAAEYERIAPRLLAAGYHALAIDQRRGADLFGVPNQTVLGMTGPEPSYCDVYPDLVAAMQLVRELGLNGPMAAWGSSYSAALVVRLGLEYPEQIAAVLAFSPASGEPMAGCEPEPWAERLQRPMLAVRPAREMEHEWIAEQLRYFGELGAETYVAPDSRHGSSMLDPQRNPSDPASTWAVVERFLRQHAPTGSED